VIDDMNAFERQVAGEVIRAAAPPRPVDVSAIFTATTAAQSPKWRFQTMFSATKFVVAGAVVALFGGFLLSGALTQQPSVDRLPAVGASASATTQAEPTDSATSEPEPTTEAEAEDTTPVRDLLPGVDLVTEEVEPGAYRVLSDGVRALESEPSIDRVGDMRLIGTHHNIAAGLDGSVWLFGPEAFYRIGEADRFDWPEADDDPQSAMDDIEVGPDGIIWRVPILDRGPLMSFEQGSWTPRRDRAVGVEVQSDGTVWAAWLNDNDRVKVGRLDGDSWDVRPGSIERVGNLPGWQPLAVGLEPGAEPWLPDFGNGLQRFDGDGRQSEAPPGEAALRVDVAPDGTVWAMIVAEARSDGRREALARLDDGVWAVFHDTLQRAGFTHNEGLLTAGTDGSIWISPFSPLQTTVCAGVSNFDGVTLRRYLPDLCVYAMDVALDGSVWVLAGEWPEGSDPSEAGQIRTYVITPETMAAHE
jgi:hypothetical protein